MDLIYKIILIYGFFIQVTTCLRLVRIGVPAYKIRGETAILECIYELHNKNNYGIDNVFGTNYESSEQNDEAETLYSVKWYKDNEEFFRYVPSMIPFVSSFRVDGIRVDDVASNSTHVKLRSVTLRSTGLYRCEVSAEAPSFASVQGEGRMEVVYLPKEGPHITGDDKIYQIGDTLLLNCTSGKSHPATKLSWFINDEPLMYPANLIHFPELTNIHGLKTSILGLQMHVEGKHFRGGQMLVRCLASLSPVLWKGTQGTVVQRRQDVVDNREAMLLVRSSSSRNKQLLSIIISTLIGTLLTFM